MVTDTAHFWIRGVCTCDNLPHCIQSVFIELYLFVWRSFPEKHQQPLLDCFIITFLDLLSHSYVTAFNQILR